jgi:ElaB/YqjD/DUF883 family membrane-anchored ribosome-binding protein
MNAKDLYSSVSTKTSWRRAMVLAAGLAIVASATAGNAMARLTDDPPAAEEKGFDKPLGKKQAAHGKGGGQTTSTSTMSMISDDGENRYELNVKGDNASAKMNGKEVPADRLVKTDAGYEIKDEAGKTVYTFKVNNGGGLRMLWNGGGAAAPEAPDAPEAPVAPRAATPRFRAIAPGATAIARAGSTPKLMIGITMSEPEARLLKHLGAEDGIIIDSVRPNTPADKAGLKEEDVIVAIDDTKPVNQEKLREITQGKKPGDQLKLHVIRDGKPVDLTLTLDKWDAKVMGDGAWTMTTSPQFLEGLPLVGGHNQELAALLDAVEEQLQTLKDNPELKPEALKARADDISKTIQDALEKAIESLKQAHEKISSAVNTDGFGLNVFPDGDNTITLTPRLFDRAAGDMDAQQERLDKLQEELERAMDKRQEALDREMEARQAALEKMQEQMQRQFEKMQEQMERQREQAEREKNTR